MSRPSPKAAIVLAVLFVTLLSALWWAPRLVATCVDFVGTMNDCTDFMGALDNLILGALIVGIVVVGVMLAGLLWNRRSGPARTDRDQDRFVTLVMDGFARRFTEIERSAERCVVVLPGSRTLVVDIPSRVVASAWPVLIQQGRDEVNINDPVSGAAVLALTDIDGSLSVFPKAPATYRITFANHPDVFWWSPAPRELRPE
jgi:hypothetical protein